MQAIFPNENYSDLIYGVDFVRMKKHGVRKEIYWGGMQCRVNSSLDSSFRSIYNSILSSTDKSKQGKGPGILDVPTCILSN